MRQTTTTRHATLHPTTPRTPAAWPLVPVVCLECGKKFRARCYGEECPKCGGVDIDVRDTKEGR